MTLPDWASAQNQKPANAGQTPPAVASHSSAPLHERLSMSEEAFDALYVEDADFRQAVIQMFEAEKSIAPASEATITFIAAQAAKLFKLQYRASFGEDVSDVQKALLEEAVVAGEAAPLADGSTKDAAVRALRNEKSGPAKSEKGQRARLRDAMTGKDMRKLARRFAKESLHVMRFLMMDPSQSGTVRLAAAAQMQERAYGKTEVVTEVAEGLADMSPIDAMQHVVSLISEGDLSIESGDRLMRILKVRVDVSEVETMRRELEELRGLLGQVSNERAVH